jgi:hypothetical protein
MPPEQLKVTRRDARRMGPRYSIVSQSEIIFSVQESPEGGYEARALGVSIFTQADSLAECEAMIRDAVSCHFANGDKPSAKQIFV